MTTHTNKHSYRYLRAIIHAALFLCLFKAPFSATICSALPIQKQVKKTASSSSLETYRLLNLFGDVFAKTRNVYVEPIEDQELIQHALNGMLSSLDPHSGYMNEKEFQELTSMTNGNFGGLGIEVIMEHGVIKVISPVDDTPAFRAGLKAGDYIVEIDDDPVLGLSSNEAVDRMKGKPGTQVKLKVVRAGQEPIEMSITREPIQVKPVRWKVLNDVGYIRISTFISSKTDDKVLEAIKEIQKKAGHNLKGYIIDLRNNPGGLLEQAIDVAGLFLGKGKEVVSIRGRTNPVPKRFYSQSEKDETNGLPIVVLVNNGTASSPEIMAGALKDHNRAVIMGTRTFGKGSVQTIFPISGRGAMRLTTDLYYTPSGKTMQTHGIEPHVTVKPAKIEPIEAGQFREEDIPNALLNELIDSAKEDKIEKGGKSKAADMLDLYENEDIDFQIQRAIDLIQGLSIISNPMTENEAKEEGVNKISTHKK